MSPEQVAEALRIVDDFGLLSDDERKLVLAAPDGNPVLSPWVNNPVPLKVVRDLFTKLAAIPVRPAV